MLEQLPNIFADMLAPGEEEITLKQVLDGPLNFEPVYLPQTWNNPVSDTVDQADHRTVLRVPRRLFEASLNEVGQVNLDLLLTAIQAEEDRSGIVKIGEVGPNYTPLLNSQLVETVEPIANSGLVKLIGGGSILDGKKVFLQFQICEFEPVPGDIRVGKVLFANAHDSSIAPGAFFTETAVKCDNSLKLAMAKAARRMQVRHSAKVFSEFQNLVEAIDLVKQGFKDQNDHLQELAKVKIEGEEHLRKIIRAAYRKSVIIADEDGNEVTEKNERKGRTEDRLVELFVSAPGNEIEGINGTGLALHEAMTYFLTHEAGNTKTTSDSRLNSNLFLDQNRQLVDRLDSAILAQR